MSYAIPVAILLIRGRNIVSNNPPIFYLGHTVGYVMNWIAVLFVFITSIVRALATNEICLEHSCTLDAKTAFR